MPDQHTRRPWNISKISLFIASASLIVSLIGLRFIIANYNIQARADRPSVRATGADIAGTADPDTYTLAVALYNSGKEDARDITIKTAMIDLTMKQPKLIVSEQLSRIGASLPYAYQAKFSIHKTDVLKFVVFCVTYTDDLSNHFEPEASIMTFPAWPASKASGWASLITLLSDTAYHSFIGSSPPSRSRKKRSPVFVKSSAAADNARWVWLGFHLTTPPPGSSSRRLSFCSRYHQRCQSGRLDWPIPSATVNHRTLALTPGL
jgi:hypothetical protein